MFEVYGAVENGAEAVAKLLELRPDAIILDLAMPVMNGLRRRERSPKTFLTFRFSYLRAPLLRITAAPAIAPTAAAVTPCTNVGPVGGRLYKGLPG